MSEFMDEDPRELESCAKFIDIDAFSCFIVDIFSLAKFFSLRLSRRIIGFDIELEFSYEFIYLSAQSIGCRDSFIEL